MGNAKFRERSIHGKTYENWNFGENLGFLILWFLQYFQKNLNFHNKFFVFF
jgi:hypothetical protein